jgi:hypothetical protein
VIEDEARRIDQCLQVLPVDILTVQELRQRDEVTCSKLLSCSPIIRIILGSNDQEAAADGGGGVSDYEEMPSPSHRRQRDAPGPVKIFVPIPPASAGAKGRGGRPGTAGCRPLAAARAGSAAGRHSSLGIHESTLGTNGRGGTTSSRGRGAATNRRPKTAHLITYRGSGKLAFESTFY